MYKQITESTPQRSSKNFLQKFEGRTSTIGRAGLLSLLQQNNSPAKNQNEGLLRYIDQIPIKARNQLRNPQVNRFSIDRIAQDDKRSSNQSFRTQPRRSMGSMSQLGTTNRSNQKSSMYNSKFALNVPLMSSVQLKTERKPSLIGMSMNNPSNQAYSQKKITSDDRFKHLQFLNQFEERMKKNQGK